MEDNNKDVLYYKRKKIILYFDGEYTSAVLPSVKKKCGKHFVRVDKDRDVAVRKAKETIDETFP